VNERFIEVINIANAMGKSVPEFQAQLRCLTSIGFPRPTDSANEIWRVADVFDWVTRQQEINIALLGALTKRP